EARGEIGGDADHDAGLAVLGDADDRDHAGADLLLAVVHQALEVLGLDALDGARQQLDVADLAHARATTVRGGAAAHGELLARIRQVTLELLALVHQRGNARRHVLDRRTQLLRRGFGQRNGVIGVLAGIAAGQRLDAADAGGDRAFAGHRD